MSEDFDYESSEWDDEREEALRDWNGLCERCGCTTDSPHVHHNFGTRSRSYSVLCPDCHADHHDNPEIASYRKTYPKCRFCNKEMEWGSSRGKWVLIESNGRVHRCDAMNQFFMRKDRNCSIKPDGFVSDFSKSRRKADTKTKEATQ